MSDPTNYVAVPGEPTRDTGEVDNPRSNGGARGRVPPKPKPPLSAEQRRTWWPKMGPPRASWIILWLILGFVAIMGAAGWIVVWMKQNNFTSPQWELPILVVGSVMVLLIGLAGTAIIFHRLQLDDPLAPMGLPEGSIRAIIALMLIVIFAVISIFLVVTGGQSGLHTVQGLTAAQINQIDPTEVVSKMLTSGSPTSATGRYTVILNVDNKTADQMAQQLLTTLGTLVVAVASFYFGSQTVAARQQRPAGAGTPADAGVGQPANDHDPSAAGSTDAHDTAAPADATAPGNVVGNSANAPGVVAAAAQQAAEPPYPNG